MLSLVIFSGRNFNRIYNEIHKYDYQFILNPAYKVDDNHFRINILIQDLKKHYENCNKDTLTFCKDYKGIYIKRKFSYYYLMKKND